MSEPARQTIRVCYSGRVQGVGFRYTVCEIVRRHPVDGFVRNLPDGRVELLVQGTSDQINPVLRAISDHFQGNITGEDRQPLLPDEDFEGFEIRY